MPLRIGQIAYECYRATSPLGWGEGGMAGTAISGQEPGLSQTLDRLPAVGLEFFTLVLAFTLAIFVVLVFGVRLVMVVRKQPMPLDPLDMAKPRAFRTVMLAFSVALAPLAALDFLPTEGMDRSWALVVAYVVALLVAAAAWLLLEAFYRRRGAKRGAS